MGDRIKRFNQRNAALYNRNPVAATAIAVGYAAFGVAVVSLLTERSVRNREVYFRHLEQVVNN